MLKDSESRDRIRIVILGGAGALAFFAMGASAQQATAGMGGVAQMKPNSVPLGASEPDSVRRPARAAECAERADARGLRGKARKHALRECRRGP